nr:replication protein A 70 kDa DNA-binding subunit B-like [Ipomoea batatas]
MEKVIGGKQTRLMDFVLEDVSKRQIHCTLWDEHVDQLIPYYNSTVVDPVILIIQLCRAKFMDNGEVHICSSFDATQLFFTHTSKEFVNFKNSFRADYTSLRCIESASRLAVGFPINGVGSNNQIITSIEDIYKKKELGNYWVAGTITGVESLLDWCYMSCKSNSCKRKLSESGGMMYCVGCKRSWHEGILRYKLVVRVADHTGDAPMLIWDRECASLVGMSAGELKGKYPEGVHVIPNEIAALRGMSMLFQIVMKKEQVDNYYSAFTVLRICRDEVVLTQHCSGLFDRNEGDLVAANGGDWLDFEDNSEDGVVSDDDGSRGLDAMYKEMEKDKIVDLGDSDGASSSEQATLPLKRCLIDEFDCVGGTSIIDDFDCVGGTSKKAKEIVVKLEKM